MSTPDTRPGTGFVTWAGLAVVWAAAAVLSFASLRDLAASCKVAVDLAWLLPIVIDAGAAVGTRAWLSRRANPDAERFARAMTWALLLLTVAANAGHQGMVAHGVIPPWPVAVLVGAIPPAVVGAVVHLAVLLGRGAPEPGEDRAELDPPTPVSAEVLEPGPDADLAVRVAHHLAVAARNGEPRPGRRTLAVRVGAKDHQVRAALKTLENAR